MVAFATRRLLLAVVVLLAFSLASFCLFAGEFRSPLSGQPLLAGYWHWLRGVPTGHSLSTGLMGPILPTLTSALGHTLVLLAVTLLLVVVFGLGLGLVAAAKRGSILDGLLRGGSYLGWAIPPFLLALLVEELVARIGGQQGLGPFPVAGWAGWCPIPPGLNAGALSCPPAGTGLDYVANVLRSVTLPALTLAVGFIGLQMRYLRVSLIVALDAPYTTTARAKGLPERLVLVRHALRNSLAAFVSALFSDFGAIFGAALAIDWIFQLNGIGSLFIREVGINYIDAASFSVDVYAIQALLLATALILLASSFVSELAVFVLDPRARPE
ncbi:MAG TPA: ABC transporter permease [Gaiellaceae bacterium]|nr:ABC transporter permease [Gaiellaceae bacterium]